MNETSKVSIAQALEVLEFIQAARFDLLERTSEDPEWIRNNAWVRDYGRDLLHFASDMAFRVINLELNNKVATSRLSDRNQLVARLRETALSGGDE